jgi:hypothetical protein
MRVSANMDEKPLGMMTSSCQRCAIEIGLSVERSLPGNFRVLQLDVYRHDEEWFDDKWGIVLIVDYRLDRHSNAHMG